MMCSSAPNFSSDSPQVLFDHPSLLVGTVAPRYDVANDGERFVLTEPLEGQKPISIHVVENWYEEFHDREQD